MMAYEVAAAEPNPFTVFVGPKCRKIEPPAAIAKSVAVAARPNAMNKVLPLELVFWMQQQPLSVPAARITADAVPTVPEGADTPAWGAFWTVTVLAPPPPPPDVI
jgi:hypothetical protein